MADLNSNSPDIEKKASTYAEGEDILKPSSLDTVHGDEAVNVIHNYSGETTWTEQEEKRLVRKVDVRLITILAITGALQFYDKALLSSAVRGSPPAVSGLPTLVP
jgi:hypothetical protein